MIIAATADPLEAMRSDLVSGSVHDVMSRSIRIDYR